MNGGTTRETTKIDTHRRAQILQIKEIGLKRRMKENEMKKKHNKENA